MIWAHSHTEGPGPKPRLQKNKDISLLLSCCDLRPFAKRPVFEECATRIANRNAKQVSSVGPREASCIPLHCPRCLQPPLLTCHVLHPYRNCSRGRTGRQHTGGDTDIRAPSHVAHSSLAQA